MSNLTIRLPNFFYHVMESWYWQRRKPPDDGGPPRRLVKKECRQLYQHESDQHRWKYAMAGVPVIEGEPPVRHAPPPVSR